MDADEEKLILYERAEVIQHGDIFSFLIVFPHWRMEGILVGYM